MSYHSVSAVAAAAMMMDSLYNTATPPHLRHHHRTLSSRVPYSFASNTAAVAISPSAAMQHSTDCREDDEGLMFQLDLEDDKHSQAVTAAGLAANTHSFAAWSHYTSRLPSSSVSSQPLRPATASPSFSRTTPLPCSPSVKQPMKYGSAQQPHRASLSPTIPTLSSRMRSSTPTNRTAVPSPSARLIKALPLSPAASTTSSSSCVSQCSSAASDDDDYPSLDYTLSPSLPSPPSPIAVLTAASTPASLSRRSSFSLAAPLSSLPLPPSLPRASTLPTTKAQQWRSDKCIVVESGSGSGSEVKRASVSVSRPSEESDISSYIFELEL